ncbi:catalase 1 [Recurvomyces mirabilis]|uniref:Catalase 1 n=1 Tax=Recurvomyces mirabilis TaxID=574656 RepID=A0AAE1BYI8_9PEZI|nr:catalase 1 [Recurvomyces mirabilis]KAK5155002.1 catalase 1 [Recurvomyces mirabilis]
MTKRLSEIDLELAQQVADLAGAPVPQEAGPENHGKKAKGLSQTEAIAPGSKGATIATRRVALTIADGPMHSHTMAWLQHSRQVERFLSPLCPKRIQSLLQPNSFKEAFQMAKGVEDFVDAYTFALAQHKNFDREMQGFPTMVAY